MKLNKLNILGSLFVLATAYILLTSSSGGVTGASTAGCSCHGPASLATTISLTGIPIATGWVPGGTYSVSLSVTNLNKTGAGFNLTVSQGSISNASINTAISGASSNELNHTATKAMTAGTATWTFDWTAPTTPTSAFVNIYVAGNAVNSNTQSSGDAFNIATFNFVQLTNPNPAPTISNTNITSITSTGATIAGSGIANNASSTVSLEYGLTTSYGSTGVPSPSTINGSSATSVSTTLTGLSPATLYHARYKITNANGTNYSNDTSFTTLVQTALPTIIMNPVSNITATGAKVNAQVNANNANTTVTVEYGLTTAYGSTMNATPNTVTGNTNTAISANLTGLTPSTVYHYRVKATNSVGPATSPDAIFTTGPTSINDIQRLNMKVYPNPCTDKLFIESETKSTSIKVVAYSMLGSRFNLPIKIVNDFTYSLDIKSIPSANYILIIEHEGKVVSTQFQKQ